MNDSATSDFERLLTGNLARVFSEPDDDRRRSALAELWDPDAVLYEDGHRAQGLDAIGKTVGDLLKSLPPGTTFIAEGGVVGHNGAARVRWSALDANGQAGPVTGTDVAFIEDGRISRLYVFLDPLP